MGCINSKQIQVGPAETVKAFKDQEKRADYSENVVYSSRYDHKTTKTDGDPDLSSQELDGKPSQSTEIVDRRLSAEDIKKEDRGELVRNTSRSTLKVAEIHHIKVKSDSIASNKDGKTEVATQTEVSGTHYVGGINLAKATQTDVSGTHYVSCINIENATQTDVSGTHYVSCVNVEKATQTDVSGTHYVDGINLTGNNFEKEKLRKDQEKSKRNENEISETALYNSNDSEETGKIEEETEWDRIQRKSCSKPIDYEIVQGHPLKPPKLKKSQIIPDSSMFKLIDEYVEKTPSDATNSVPDLAKYICKVASDELEKVRAVHRWIVCNVSYDEAGKKSGNKLSCDAAAVLRNRRCVCAGYANLFKELCKECGVVAEVVSGFSKGRGWIEIAPHSLSDTTDHSWNAVFVNDDWRLVDCTWESKNEGDFYFLTDPDRFLNEHFPFDKDEIVKSFQWQLMETPMDFDTFCASVQTQPHAYTFCVEPVTHRNSIIEVEKEVEICMRAIPNALDGFTANLVSMSGTVYENSIIVYKKKVNIYCIRIKPPLLMVFRLRIFGTRSSDKNDNKLHHLYDYIINCKSVHSNLIPYPKLKGVWGVEKSYSAYGFADGFPEQAFLNSKKGKIKMKFPVQENILPTCTFELAHTDDEDSAEVYTYMERTDKDILVTARLAKTGFYKLDVFARELDSKENTTELMASYLVECDTPLVPCPRYPKHFGEALQYQVSLKEPLTESLPSNTEIRFRLSSPLLARVAINDTIVQKNEEDMFDLTITTPDYAVDKLCIYGHTEMTGSSFNGLFEFKLI